MTPTLLGLAFWSAFALLVKKVGWLDPLVTIYGATGALLTFATLLHALGALQ